MNYLLALIPAIGWGIMPLITGKIGGSTINQMFGIGAGATIVGLVAFIIGHPTVTTTGFWFSVLCGALGQLVKLDNSFHLSGWVFQTLFHYRQYFN